MDDHHPLQAVSNVIELKPDKQYLLVFSGEKPVTVEHTWELN